MSLRKMPWLKMPTWWIETDNRLPQFDWRTGGSDETAALMCYILLVHRSHGVPIDVRVTYADFMETLGHSKAKVSAGLSIIRERGLVEAAGTSHYRVVDMDCDRPWGKLPHKAMYSTAQTNIPMFHAFNMRSKHELNALKLLTLLCARTETATGRAMISADRVSTWSGIPKNDVKRAGSYLINFELMQRERIKDIETGNVYWGYRLTGAHPKRHGANTSPEDWVDDAQLEHSRILSFPI